MNIFNRAFPFIASLFICGIVTAQKINFTEDQLLKNKSMPTITQPSPLVVKWTDDKTVVLNMKVHPDSASRRYFLNAKTGKETAPTPLTLEHKGASFSVKSNDIFYKANDSAKETRLTNNPEPEINATFSPDSQYIAYTRKNDLYTVNVQSAKETRITTDGNDLILNGYASWVYYEEILGRASRYKSFWWSPDSKHIAFMHMDQSMVPMFPIYSEVGQQGFLEETRYPKAGNRNPEVKIGIVAPDNNQIVWADFNAKDDQYFGMPVWRPDGSSLLVSWMNRDQNTLKIFDVNLTDGTKKPFYEETQKAWVDLEDNQRIRFLGNDVLFLSDKDGWKNIYLHNSDGSFKKQLTNGNFWATNVLYVDNKRKWIVFTAKKENSTRLDIYRVGFDGKEVKRLSFGDYTHKVELSTDGSYFITTYSNVTTPPQTALVDMNGKIIRVLGDAATPTLNNYNIAKTELVRVPSADGLFDLPMRITWPANYDSTKKYPVWISIYGGPNAGTVTDGWKFTQMQQWWSQEGFIQVAMDHRGSGHFGKKGLDYLHRNLGYWEMQDWIQLVKWLRNHGGDSSKVLIQGFSYGGYMSAYALTYGADYFTHGLAGGSVVDWSLYDTHYTERFMGTPQNNPQGYKSSSVLTYANKLKGKLLLYHGSMDDNVHLQNSLQLVKKLQDLDIDFEYMVYPGGRHGWGGKQQAFSQHKINKFVYQYLLNKPVPEALLH